MKKLVIITVLFISGTGFAKTVETTEREKIDFKCTYCTKIDGDTYCASADSCPDAKALLAEITAAAE